MQLWSRRNVLAAVAGSGLGALGLGGYALSFEPLSGPRVQRYGLNPSGWPAGLKLRIAVLADIHAGMPTMPIARVREIVEATNALEPDLTVLLGDYSNTDRLLRRRADWSEVVPALAALEAPLGRFAILGNHEWWDDPTAQRRRRGPTLAHAAFARTDIPLLENDARRLVKEGRPFWLLGLGDQIAFRLGHRQHQVVDDLPDTLAQVTDDAPALLLVHEPDIFPKVPKRVAVTLAGHTHGGQVRLFGWSPVVPSRFGNRYAYGHIVEDDRHLIVSGGLGTVSAGLAPVRLGMPPEIVMVEIGAEAPTAVSGTRRPSS
jgi:predicted MPP superfamily phosphohydrolase